MKLVTLSVSGALLLRLGTAGFALPITPVVPDAARPLPLTAVRLTGGPLKNAQDLDAKYLLALQPDRLMIGSLARFAYAGDLGEEQARRGRGRGNPVEDVPVFVAAER